MDKQFSLTREYVSNSEIPKACKKCGGVATQEAVFAIGDGMNVVERYCDLCIKGIR